MSLGILCCRKGETALVHLLLPLQMLLLHLYFRLMHVSLRDFPITVMEIWTVIATWVVLGFFCVSLCRTTDGYSWADKRSRWSRDPLPRLPNLYHEGAFPWYWRSSSPEGSGGKKSTSPTSASSHASLFCPECKRYCVSGGDMIAYNIVPYQWYYLIKNPGWKGKVVADILDVKFCLITHLFGRFS